MTTTDFNDFGVLLRFLRRQARLTQRDLGLAVGYSEAQISRLEQRRRPPDPVAVAALFVPALRLAEQSTAGRRLVELAWHARRPTTEALDLADIPPPPTHLVTRGDLLTHLIGLLAVEHRVLIGGAPGVGKTTLVAAAARDLAPSRAVCWVALTPDVTLTVPALLRRLAVVLARHGESCVAPIVLWPPTTDEGLRMLTRGLAGCPTLLCLDDGHLLAQAPDVLAVVRHLLATTALELLVASRTNLVLSDTAVLRVPGLRPEEGRGLVADLAALPAALADRLVARTDGNPMLIRLALARLRSDDGDPGDFVARLEKQPDIRGYLSEIEQSPACPHVQPEG